MHNTRLHANAAAAAAAAAAADGDDQVNVIYCDSNRVRALDHAACAVGTPTLARVVK
jgi:hypothetical protein